MPQSEKKTGEGGEKKPRKKAANKDAAKEQPEPTPAPTQLDRDQLESLREKLQKKFH
jgi:hypothetical protein